MSNINLGNDSIGGMTLTGLSDNTFYGILVGSAVSNGILQSITIYVKDFNSLGPFNLNVALYDATGVDNRPGDRLIIPHSAIVTNDYDNWLTVDLSAQEYEIAGGTAYWICFGFEPDKIPQIYNVASAAELSVYSAGSLDNPWGGGGPVGVRVAGYLTYESPDNVFGNPVAGSDGSLGLPDEDMFGHFDADEITNTWDADIVASVVNKVWVYARGRAGFDAATLRIAVYDASDPSNELWTVEAESPSIPLIADDVARWYSVECNLTLTAGKKSLAVISYGGDDTSANIYFDNVVGLLPVSQTFIDDSGEFDNPLGVFSGDTQKNWSVYVEYTESIPRSPSANLFAPVDAIPTLTSGRNSSGFSSGHDPKYTLDNDLDTWWTPNAFTDSSIYFDLGAATLVEAMTLWLHNYNENYTDDKAWRVSYSHDDITYTSLATRLFSDYRTSYSPVVVDVFDTLITARYWRVEFLNFSSTPQVIKPEISCVWFLNDYSLPWKHQRPESNTILYHNNGSITRSGHRFASPAGVGRQRVIQRQFLFTTDSGQWSQLKNAYDAARGQNLPIIMQSELDSTEYYALQFDSPMSESRQEFESWTPQLTFRELGFKRVPFVDRSLYATRGTVALYHLRGDGTDYTGQGNDLTQQGDASWLVGGTEQGITAYNAILPAYTLTSALPISDLELDEDDFTIEIWMRAKPEVVISNSNVLFKVGAVEGFSVGFNLVMLNGVTFFGGAPDRLRMELYGNETTYLLEDSPSHNAADGEWHYFVFVVNRATSTGLVYYDGDLMTDNFDNGLLGSVGSISNTNAPVTMRPGYEGVELDEVAVHRDVLLTATEIANRYAGRLNYGTWGM